MINLNWTIQVFILLISLGPLTFAVYIAFSEYLKGKHRHNLFMMLTWLIVMIMNILVIISNLILSPTLYLYSMFLWILSAIFMSLLFDSVSRESIDPKKLIIISIFATAIVFISFDPNAVVYNYFPNGEIGLLMGGNFRIINSILFLFIIGMYAFYTLKIHWKAPKNLKLYSYINLFGALAVVGSVIIVLIGLNKIIPGIDFLIVAIAGLFTAIAFVKEPRLAYILPFKVMRLTVIDTKSGISIFNHNWKAGETLVDESLFSGMLQGISAILNEAVGKGNVRGILLDQALLIIKRNEEYPIACVLIATKSTKSLRQALNSFSDKFITQFSQFFSDTSMVSNFESASDLIEECFPFVPEYD